MIGARKEDAVTSVNRRRFVQLGGMAATALGAARGNAFASGQTAAERHADTEDRRVRLTGDGVSLNPAQYASLLARLSSEKAIAPDSFSLGGVVEELETEM